MNARTAPGRAMPLLIALGLDAAFGDVGGAAHPVAVAGRLLERGYAPWRRRAPAAQFLGGALALSSVALPAGFAGLGVERLARHRPGSALLLGLLLKPSFAVRDLLGEAGGVATSLQRQQLPEARYRLRALVSRPAEALSAEMVASAAIESLAENLADSVVAPLMYHATLGLGGAAAYRIVNTADAMVGYHGETEWLGKSAARTDDLLNWLPSRVSALALIAAAHAVEGPWAGARAWRTWRRDRRRTDSPNAGQPMAAMAGALGRRLEKPEHYVLGAVMPMPSAVDVLRAVRLTRAAAAGVVALVLVLEALRLLPAAAGAGERR